MQEGSSVATRECLRAAEGQAGLGTRYEIKNLNSFRFVERAINHEVERQVELTRAAAV